MSGEAIKSVCSPGATSALPPFPPLCASVIDPAIASNEVELQLRILVAEYRKVPVIFSGWCRHGLVLLPEVLGLSLLMHERRIFAALSCHSEQIMFCCKV